MTRLYDDFITGNTVGEIAAAATTFSGSGLTDLLEVTGGDTVTIVFDPEGQGPGPVVTQITAHNVGSGDATIDPPGVIIPHGTEWIHAVMAADMVDPAEISRVGHDHGPQNFAPDTHDHDPDYAPLVHDHDDLYYTEGEVDGFLQDKADSTHTHDFADVDHTHDEGGGESGASGVRSRDLFLPGTLAQGTLARVAMDTPEVSIRRVSISLGTAPVGATPTDCLQVSVRGENGGSVDIPVADGDLDGRHLLWSVNDRAVDAEQTTTADNVVSNDAIAAATLVRPTSDIVLLGVEFLLRPNPNDPTDSTLDGLSKSAVLLDAARSQYLAIGDANYAAIEGAEDWLYFPLRWTLTAATDYYLGIEVPDNARRIRMAGAESPTAPAWTGNLDSITTETVVFDASNVAQEGTDADGRLVGTAVTTLADGAVAMRLHVDGGAGAVSLYGRHFDVVVTEVGTAPEDPGADMNISVDLTEVV